MNSIPQELKEHAQWVVWKYEDRKGKQTKVPYQVNGKRASVTKPTTWDSYEIAVQALEANKDIYTGVGFVVTQNDPFVGVDLDNCLNEQWAKQTISLFNSYTEITPSGKGYRIWIKGKWHNSSNRVAQIEVYNQERFFTFTSNHVASTPTTVEYRQEQLDLFSIIMQVCANDKAKRLWQGDLADHSSESEADLALCSYIARYTRNKDTILKIVQHSGLWDDKWSRLDYQERTIGAALRGGCVASTLTVDDIKVLNSCHKSDTGNAECLAYLYGDILRYCNTRKTWFVWDGVCWKQDAKQQIIEYATNTIRARQQASLSIEDNDIKNVLMKFCLTSENVNKLQALIHRAQALPQLATTVDMYDRDIYKVGLVNGTLDLRTSAFYESRPEDYITKQLRTRYDINAKCPRWLQFLDEVFNGDQELIAYIQRAMGYTLTGDTSEQCLFLLYGSGANGKSKFITVLKSLLSDYAAQASFDTFDADRANPVNNDLAKLQGTRFVSIVETDDNRVLAEAKVKSATGQDEITCRFLYGEYFSYLPQFKIWLAMNHKPIVRGTDVGIWRRIRIIPFTQNFDKRPDKDEYIEQKLLAELPGILNWILEGLRTWQQKRLGTAQAIEQATAEYKGEMDIVQQWLDECTTPVEYGDLVLTKDAYTSFSNWCKTYGYRAIPAERSFGRSLAEKGFAPKRTNKAKGWIGFALLEQEHTVVVQGNRLN